MKDIMPHLHSWLLEELPDVIFEYQHLGPESDALVSPHVLIQDTGGLTSDFPGRQSVLLSVVARSGDASVSRALIYLVDSVLRSRYSLALNPPADMPGSGEIEIGAVVPMAAPAPLGDVGNGVYEYVATYQILL